MSSNKTWIRSFDVKSPVIPIDSDFVNTLLNPKENWIPKRLLDLKTLSQTYRRETRRMNRTSSMGYLSATSAMEKSGLVQEEYDPHRFGTVFSTTNASYESVLSILNSLYEDGLEYISPIDFTYSVGNSLISGITMKYNLKGPSVMLPSTEPLFMALITLEQDDIDRILVGNYNICLEENLKFYSQFDYLQGDESKCTGILEDANGMVVREQGVSIILEKDELRHGKEGCELLGLSIKNKRKLSNEKYKNSLIKQDSAYNLNTYIELSEFSQEDFEDEMKNVLLESNIEAKDVDAVFMCAGGHSNLDSLEYEAVSNIMPNAKMVSIQGIFGSNFGSSFMLNCAAAVASLQEQKLPGSVGVKDSSGRFSIETEESDLKTVVVNGYNDLGNIISGVLQWN